MATGKNKHTSYELDVIKNAYGDHDNVGDIRTITINEFYERGCVIPDSTGCHAWTRAKMNGWQYGVINLIGLDRKKSHLAHRVALHITGELAYDDPRHVLHTCDKHWCVNPDHLYSGTDADNARDRRERPPIRGEVQRGVRRSRPQWKVTWFVTAQIIAERSECVRRRAGCTIVGPDNRIVSTGFNGKPGELDVSGPCDGYCPRASTGGSLDYSDCVFVHSEMNALMYSDRTRREGGTAYVTSCPCLACAKALANSGLSSVVCAVGVEDRNRQPERSIDLMMNSGIHVEIFYQPRWEPTTDDRPG